jgi:Fe-S cluster assembly ATP-binding protein
MGILVMLKLIDIALVRNGKHILHDLDLEVAEGEVHAVLGLNGAGKSTLAAVVMGLGGYAPSSGRIHFRGEEITRLPLLERARLGITLAWQEPARFEGLTVAEYLQAGQRQGRPTLLSPKECLSMVGLPPERYLTRAVDSSLSGGERKRVELAAVLAMKPALTILDEPDSGIDILSVSHIVNGPGAKRERRPADHPPGGGGGSGGPCLVSLRRHDLEDRGAAVHREVLPEPLPGVSPCRGTC